MAEKEKHVFALEGRAVVVRLSAVTWAGCWPAEEVIKSGCCMESVQSAFHPLPNQPGGGIAAGREG